MLKKWLLAMCLTAVAFGGAVSAQERMTYVSQPDEVTVFLNNIAYVRDTLRVPGDASVSVSLPATLFEETLIVREDGVEVPRYTLNTLNGVRILTLDTIGDEAQHDLTLEYLTTGLSWQPNYRMTLNAEDESQVQFSYYAALHNDSFTLDEAVVRLAAGSVDAYETVETHDGRSMNQMYTSDQMAVAVNAVDSGSITIQYTYDIGTLSTTLGDTIYTRILDETFAARRILLWNAKDNSNVSVIYKVLNSSDLPLTAGIVRNYQDGLFIGSDGIEFTPVNSEGSVTVGNVQDMRVERLETVTAASSSVFSLLDTLHEVTLTLSNFSSNDITIEVVDTYPRNAQEFTYSQEATAEAGNVLRWVVTVKAGETTTITYQFKAEY